MVNIPACIVSTLNSEKLPFHKKQQKSSTILRFNCISFELFLLLRSSAKGALAFLFVLQNQYRFIWDLLLLLHRGCFLFHIRTTFHNKYPSILLLFYRCFYVCWLHSSQLNQA